MLVCVIVGSVSKFIPKRVLVEQYSRFANRELANLHDRFAISAFNYVDIQHLVAFSVFHSYLVSNTGTAGATFGKTCRKRSLLGIHYRGVQWEGGAVDRGSII